MARSRALPRLRLLDRRSRNYDRRRDLNQFSYETSPTKDDFYFTSISGVQVFTISSLAPTINKALLASATTPLARWLRYKITVTGAPTSTWDVTFRAWVAANPSY